ncbi:MAG: MFS transporter [Vicinamibacterales bacterium]
MAAILPPHGYDLGVSPGASRIGRDSPAFRRTTFALFSAGFSTFALMYCVQPLLPELARVFGVSAAASSLAVSLTTGTLAVALLATGGLSESLGRKRVMVVSLVLAAALTALSAAAPTWAALLAVRTAIGLALAGLPAIAMAYVGEEIEARAVGLVMGIYVSGTAFGGMAGRLLAAVLADAASWRLAVGVTGALGLLAAAIVWAILPGSTQFERRLFSPRGLLRAYVDHLRAPVIGLLLAEGFLFMGIFMAVYNYIGFRLLAPPYGLSQSITGSIFLLYVVGMISSPWAGALAVRLGRPRTLTLHLLLMLAGVLLAATTPLPAIVIGIGLLTFGFFGAHSVASSWVGQAAAERKAQASSLYLFFYYLGASVMGAVGGIFLERWGWTGLTLFLLALFAAALLLVRPLAHRDRRTATAPEAPASPAGA